MLLAAVLALIPVTDPAVGPWHAWLDSPGGELWFGLEIGRRDPAGFAATIANGEERIDVPVALEAGDRIRFDFPHYDSRIAAKVGEGGRSLEGEFTLTRSGGALRTLKFHARAGPAPRPASSVDPRFGGRWSVAFERFEDPAVAILAVDGDRARGTFLTSTGDHRFLAGGMRDGHLRLACFDGAHAFLYTAALQADGTLKGEFFSGDSWHETWTARRDDEAAVPDEFAQARWSAHPGLAWIGGIDADGQERSLAEFLFGSRALAVQVAGSWCPNCHDEMAWFAPLARRLAGRGLAAVTLGFEFTGERERDLAQLARMRERHGAQHTFLLAGSAEKARAAQALGAIDRVVAFPTLALFDGGGRALAVHSGFRGPAAGAEHPRLLAELEAAVERALTTDAPRSAATEVLLAEQLWRDERDRTFLEFTRSQNGAVTFVERERTRFGEPTRVEPVSTGTVEGRGDSVRFDGIVWHVDPRTKSVLDPLDLAHRLTPAARGPFPYFDGAARDAPEALLAGLHAQEAALRRESAWFLVSQILTAMYAPPDHAPNVDAASAAQLLPLLEDPDPLVRATACWAAGTLRLDAARPGLEKNAGHAFAAVRREAARALAALPPR